MIALAKAAADPAGHYSRPDVTRLMFNPTPGDGCCSSRCPGVEVSRPALGGGERGGGRDARDTHLERRSPAMSEPVAPPPIESAIPPALQCPRTRHKRAPDDYVPPYPSYVARFAPGVERVVMAFLDCSTTRPRIPPWCGSMLDATAARLAAPDGPATGTARSPSTRPASPTSCRSPTDRTPRRSLAGSTGRRSRRV